MSLNPPPRQSDDVTSGTSSDYQSQVATVEHHQAEAIVNETKQEREWLTSPAESPLSIYFTLDPKGMLLAVNCIGAPRLGYTVEELIERSIFSLVDPEDRKNLQTKLTTLAQHPSQVMKEKIRLLGKQGSQFPLKVTLQALQSTDAKTVFLLAGEGITEPQFSEIDWAEREATLQERETLEFSSHPTSGDNEACIERGLCQRIEEALQKEEHLAKINECFLNFGSDPIANINSLTALCGNLLGAAGALYSRLEQGKLCTVGQWQVPSEYNCIDSPNGYICWNVIHKGSNEPFIVPNLSNTPYAQTDPKVSQFQLKTYMGQAVKCQDAYIGSLGVFYQDDFIPSEADKRLLGIIAAAIGVEETRQQAIREAQRSAEALRMSEARFRLAVDSIPDTFVIYDADRRLQFVNAHGIRLSGYSEDVLLGYTDEEIFPAEVTDSYLPFLRLAVETRTPQTAECTIALPAGTYTIVVTYVPLLDQQGNIYQILGITHDISNIYDELRLRKQAEAALQQQIHRERLIGAIAQRIRQSLELEEILNTTVAEVRQFLACDRVIIFRFNPDWSGIVAVESVDQGWIPILGTTIHDHCFESAYVQPYKEGQIQATQDIYAAGLSQCYINLLAQLQVRANLVVPILQGEQLWGLLIAHHCSAPRQWQPFEIDLLKSLSTQVAIALQQSELYKQTQHHVLREQTLNRVIQSIRNSLDIKTVFSAAASEIAQLLDADRAEIVQYLPQQNIWLNVADYRKSPDLPSTLGWEIPDQGNKIAVRLKRLEVVRIDDASTWGDKINQELAQTLPGAWLLVPLQVGSSVWGSLRLARNTPYSWQDSEVELACAVADQLAIAIQQSELFRQVQRLNAELERKVQARTAELELAFEFEATLKRITDRVRDSLDEGQILQTAVHELGVVLGVQCCNAALYDLEKGTSTICYEYTASCSPSIGRVSQMSDYSELYTQLLQGQCFQFCSLTPNPARGQVTMLACPMVDDQGVMGDLWLINHKYYGFHEQDIRLVQQVANQCAIAIRQARLYQATQAQVEMLEKLNHLKDDFLSTVSHELRTPVCNIKMAAQMLEIVLKRAGVLDTEPNKATQYFQILHDECQREISLVNNLLDLSRLEAGTEPLLMTIIDPTIWIPGIAEPFIERAREQQQHLIVESSSQLPALRTDLTDLERILSELLNNACKYTPPGGTITVSAQATDKILQLFVSNSGVEIPERELAHIFDKFYRVPNNDPWKHGGTGLGLALVKKLVEHLGATIQVTSFAGQTTFALEFPITS
ncbi:MAG: GAF domain-containing protein [Cyanobacteriota bacterium]